MNNFREILDYRSWNINGYSDDIHKYLLKLHVSKSLPDILFLSETKKDHGYLQLKFDEFTDYNFIINSHNPWKYHGVALLIHKKINFCHNDKLLNIPLRNDSKNCNDATDGRLIHVTIYIGEILLATDNTCNKSNNYLELIGTYSPNSGRQDNVKLNYRVNEWDPALYSFLNNLREESHVIWLGDINVALDDIDVSSPSTMKQYAGFTIQERDSFRKFLKSKPQSEYTMFTNSWIDIWRNMRDNTPLYTWVGNSNKDDYGMRLDNIIISASLLSGVITVYSCNEKCFSDHIPIGFKLRY